MTDCGSTIDVPRAADLLLMAFPALSPIVRIAALDRNGFELGMLANWLTLVAVGAVLMLVPSGSFSVGSAV